MPFSSDLQTAIREFAAAGPSEVRHNGTRVAPLSELSWEVRGHAEKPLLHLWSENHNLTRRILAITDHSNQRLALAVECFGRRRPDRLEFLRTEFDRPQTDLNREAFAQAIRRVCEREFPDYTLDSLSSAADLEHSLSGVYVRGVLRRGREAWALFAVPDSEGAQDPARCLTFALLWFDRLQHTASRSAIAGISVLLPAGGAASVAHLLEALRPDLHVQLFERDDLLETLRRLEPSEVTNFSSWIVPAREAQMLLQKAHQELDPLLPVSSAETISFHPNVAANEVIVRFRGLSCMCWQASGVFYGAGNMKTKLEPGKAGRVHAMFRQLEAHRHPMADTRHSMFRTQPERWLEFLVRQDVSRVDAALDARFAHSQVLAGMGGEHGILDVLTVARSGRLAILELKAGEDPVFLLQAAKYWLRAKRHLEQGDFTRNGYFPGLTLQTFPPLIYLVAPSLRFHPCTGLLLRYLAPQIEVVRVGLSESWRRGLCVVLHQ